jgi:UDP-N-acetylglucosamine pyrophosphorylase
MFGKKASNDDKFEPFEAKMKAEKLSDAAISSFKNSYMALVRGESGMIPESTIQPVVGIPSLDGDVKSSISADPELLKHTVVLKLNGGLGTGMGLNQAKSLLQVKDGLTFLDLMAMQVISLRERLQQNVRFMLMNSFSTSQDTLEFLSKYPQFKDDDMLELMQNKVPKVNADTLEPAVCKSNPSNEWCPPGHGDLYAALYGSGRLQELLDAGIIYMFVSNSDNLGATLDLDLLTWFAQTQKPFLMEVCDRTAADKKGGHLASRKADNQLVLRESAMCRKEDEEFFQDINRHSYFNTNNLWIRLDILKQELEKNNGIIPLPMIRNSKTVDPKDSSSVKVYQLETAMGAGIEFFEGAGAIVVPRSRFAPVKKCNDLFLLRSDAYEIKDDHTLQLAPELNGVPPTVDLDAKVYKFVQDLERLTEDGVPSMKRSTSLTVLGAIEFSSATTISGNVSVKNSSNDLLKLAEGVLQDEELEMSGVNIDFTEEDDKNCWNCLFF